MTRVVLCPGEECDDRKSCVRYLRNKYHAFDGDEEFPITPSNCAEFCDYYMPARGEEEIAS